MRNVACLIAAMLMGAWATVALAQDFQPDPSHMPPPPPPLSQLPPPPPPPAFPRPKRLSGDMPEYPDIARRYYAEGSVRVTLNVDAKGKVAKATIDGGVPVFYDSVLRAVRTWRFEKRPGPSVVKMVIPFDLTGENDDPRDTQVRPMLFTPTEPNQVKGDLVVGFGYVRLMIDANGKVVGNLPMGDEPEEFRRTREAIVATLKFAPSNADPADKLPNTVNSFLIDYASDGKIRVQQRPGD
jgi:TonB family protein